MCLVSRGADARNSIQNIQFFKVIFDVFWLCNDTNFVTSMTMATTAYINKQRSERTVNGNNVHMCEKLCCACARIVSKYGLVYTLIYTFSMFDSYDRVSFAVWSIYLKKKYFNHKR